MKKNVKNEELQSRRDFFKKAAKGALPILGAIVLAGSPGILKAASEFLLLVFYMSYVIFVGFSGGSNSKESTCNTRDLGSVPRWGRSPREGNGPHSSVLA